MSTGKLRTSFLLAAIAVLLVGICSNTQALQTFSGETEQMDLESQVNAYLSQEESFQYLVRFDLREDSASIAVLTRDEPLSDEMSQYVVSLVAEQGGYAPEAVDMMWIVERQPEHR